MKRHIIFPRDYDTRSNTLEDANPNWSNEIKERHNMNQKKTIAQIKNEFGEHNFDQKLVNFKDIGPLPFSIISYHNSFYRQARNSFIHEFYYPALTSACAFGERILNHLIIDLREDFKNSSSSKKVHNKGPWNNWDFLISTLAKWNIFPSNVEKEFQSLKRLRHHSIHFNLETYKNLRNDALSALKNLGEIIKLQFGFLSNQPWIIENLNGFFINKKSENNPFIKKYYLPQCPAVGPYYNWEMHKNSTRLLFDWNNYEEKDISDEEFTNLHSNRNFSQLAPTNIPWNNDITVRTIIGDRIYPCAVDDSGLPFIVI